MMSNMLGRINLSLQVRIIMCILVQSLALKPKREYMCGIAHSAAFVQWMKWEKRHNHIHCVEEWFASTFSNGLWQPKPKQLSTHCGRDEETTRARHREMLGIKTFPLQVISKRHRNEISSHCCHCQHSPPVSISRSLLQTGWCVEILKFCAGNVLVYLLCVCVCFSSISLYVLSSWCVFVGLSKWSEYWERFAAASIYSHWTVIHHSQLYIYEKSICEREWTRHPNISKMCA